MQTSVSYRFLKRVFDIFISGFAIVLLSPLALITIGGILLSDFGPVLYMADRVGKNNAHFKMFKFRSMRIDYEADEKSLRPDQKRIFPFGRFIRRTKIDELPQLLNVLIGDMSIVGPRPASLDQVSITRGGANSIVASIKPGLTSPSALYDYIYGDSIENEKEYLIKVVPTRLALDRFYTKKQTIWFDMKIVLWTLICILGTIFNRPVSFILHALLEAVN